MTMKKGTINSGQSIEGKNCSNLRIGENMNNIDKKIKETVINIFFCIRMKI